MRGSSKGGREREGARKIKCQATQPHLQADFAFSKMAVCHIKAKLFDCYCSYLL